MPRDAPDFWSVQLPAMPTIGEGQVAWFQSEAALVAADDTEDLINYVVPDDVELHVCSGVVSCGFPVLQRYLLVTTPATWVSPTSYIDPDIVWFYEERAYDEDLATSARVGVEPESWTGYLILLLNEIEINKVKFYTTYIVGYIEKIDIDVYYEGAWHDAYEGAYGNEVWVEKDVPDGVKLISKARVRFYNKHSSSIRWVSLYEFMFNTSGETAQEGIYFDTHAIIPYLPQAPYIVPARATFAVRVYNDDDAAHNMSVSLAGYLQSKV